jgi:hypothetical protein
MDANATNYDPNAPVYSWSTHSNASARCVRRNYTATDECAANPCAGLARHRLCSTPRGMPGIPCTQPRAAAFSCAAAAAAATAATSNASANATAPAAPGSASATPFTCTDPNPHWPGDYICACAYDVETGGYTNGALAAAALLARPAGTAC